MKGNKLTEPNLIKQVCKDYNLSYTDLEKIIGVKESTIRTIASTGKISKPIEASIRLFIEKEQYREEVVKAKDFRDSLREFIK